MSQTLGDGRLATFVLDLELKDDSLLTLDPILHMGPDEEEVCAHASEAVLAVDAATVVDDPLEIILQAFMQ